MLMYHKTTAETLRLLTCHAADDTILESHTECLCVFSEKVLGVVNSKGLHDPGPVRWPLALCLLAAWVVIFLCMLKGIRSSGKVRPHPDTPESLTESHSTSSWLLSR